MEKQGGALHSYLVDLLRRQLIALPCLSMDKSNRIVGQCVKCLFRPCVYERDGDPGRPCSVPSPETTLPCPGMARISERRRESQSMRSVFGYHSHSVSEAEGAAADLTRDRPPQQAWDCGLDGLSVGLMCDQSEPEPSDDSSQSDSRIFLGRR